MSEKHKSFELEVEGSKRLRISDEVSLLEVELDKNKTWVKLIEATIQINWGDIFPEGDRVRDPHSDFLKVITHLQNESIKLKADNSRLVEVLKEISEGKGRYNPDQFEHAKNTIQDMKELAIQALKDTTDHTEKGG